MKNSWLIAKREFLERIKSRSFLLMAVLGPVLILGLLYVLFAIGGEGEQKWKVLISDPNAIMDNKIMAQQDPDVSYSFANGYIEIDEFANAKRYQEFDAMVELNEKVLSNKLTFVFFRKKPSITMQSKVRYHVERRLEEVMVTQFTNLSLTDFRKIKQPLNFSFRNVYDPYDESVDLRSWVGLFFGALIFIFIFLFGMTILRSVSSEKSNRIVEVLLASVHPRQLMFGKITGIGMSALVQVGLWTLMVGLGLYFFRESIFPDVYDIMQMNIVEMSQQAAADGKLATRPDDFNVYLDLVYNRINFSVMIFQFILFLIFGYLFYGAFFTALGATVGSESDGQQFVLPLLIILCFGLYSGYYCMQYPESDLAQLFRFLPFTSPITVMVRIAQGYESGLEYQHYISLLLLFIGSIVMLLLAGRLFKNGILQFGHRLKLIQLIKWLRKT